MATLTLTSLGLSDPSLGIGPHFRRGFFWGRLRLHEDAAGPHREESGHGSPSDQFPHGGRDLDYEVLEDRLATLWDFTAASSLAALPLLVTEGSYCKFVSCFTVGYRGGLLD